MTEGGKPFQNAVIERSHHSNKNQYKKILQEWPQEVKSTRDFQKIVNKNKNIFNEKATCTKNFGLTPNRTKAFLIEHKKNVPQPSIMNQKIVLLNNERAHQDNEDITNINLYK